MSTGSLARKMSSESPVLNWEGILRSKDRKTYIYFPFEVDRDVYYLKVRLSFYQTPGNMLFLYCFDPNGFRGRGKDGIEGPGTSHIEIGTDRAGYGCIAGPIPKGKWMLEIDAQEVFGFCPYRLSVEMISQRQAPVVAFPLSTSFPQGIKQNTARWYKGELHLHSKESDGQMDVNRLATFAKEAGLDFISITDHNTTSQWHYMTGNSPVLCIPGIEVSTFHGHANVWGSEGWVDWRVGENGMDINDVIDEAHDKGGVFSINHPMAPGLEGHISWSFPETDFSKVDSMEVLNAPWFELNRDGNIKAKKLWNELLNHGIKITGVAGSDLHTFDDRVRKLGSLVNYVYAENLSEKGVLAGIKWGRVFATMGPEIYFEASYKNTPALSAYMPGDTVNMEKSEDNDLEFRINLKNAGKGLKLVVIKNGSEFMEVDSPPSEITFTDTPEKYCWYRVEIHGAPLFHSNDTLRAFTNPIYLTYSHE